MRLDKTQIAVRERDMLDILDLSLHVARAYARPLLITTALGVAPLMLLNHLLIGWMADIEYREESFFRYFWSMTLLIAVEAPLASVLATMYLGQAVFHERPSVRHVVSEVGRLLPRVAWCQLVVRGVAPALVLVLLIERGSDVNWMIEGFLLPCLAVYALILRALRPFINEIVLLERNPLHSRSAAIMTVGRRSSLLHGPNGGDLLLRWFATAMAACLLGMTFFGMFRFVSGILAGDWAQGFMPGPLTLAFLLPLSMWMVAGLMTVVRFLCYLDARIRQEGWEVELKLRAEAAQLVSKLT